MNNTNDLLKEIVILIPTINEPTLETVVAAVCAQAPSAEIVILGFGPARQVAEKFQVSFLDFGEKTPKSIMLNRAVLAMTMQWFVVLDADAIPQPGWAQAMLALFRQGHPIFSGAVDLFHGNFWMQLYNLSLLHEFSAQKPPAHRKHLPAITLGFTRDFFLRNGPLREDVVRSQDYEWTLRAYRAGYTLYFSPLPVVNHFPVEKTTLRSVLRYWVKSGKDNWAVRILYRDILRTPRWLQSPLLVLLTAPVISLVPVLRLLVLSPRLALSHVYYLPFLYLTKIAWCIGVFTANHCTGGNKLPPDNG